MSAPSPRPVRFSDDRLANLTRDPTRLGEMIGLSRVSFEGRLHVIEIVEALALDLRDARADVAAIVQALGPVFDEWDSPRLTASTESMEALRSVVRGIMDRPKG